ncbi:MAG TPA: FHA domain-containing protein [bacterium]|nr:FHA domain-containing protein [bacterium]
MKHVSILRTGVNPYQAEGTGTNDESDGNEGTVEGNTQVDTLKILEQTAESLNEIIEAATRPILSLFKSPLAGVDTAADLNEALSIEEAEAAQLEASGKEDEADDVRDDLREELEDKLADLDEAIAKDPNDKESFRIRAGIHHYLSNYKAALQDFQAVSAKEASEYRVELTETFKDLLPETTVNLPEMIRIAEALRDDSTPPAGSSTNWAAVRDEIGKPEYLEAFAREWLTKAQQLIGTGDLDAAEEALDHIKDDLIGRLTDEEKAAFKGTQNEPILRMTSNFLRGQIASVNDHEGEAREIFEGLLPALDDLLKNDSANKDALRLRAAAHNNLQQFGEALKDYEALSKEEGEEYKNNLTVLADELSKERTQAAGQPQRELECLLSQARVAEALGDKESVARLSKEIEAKTPEAMLHANREGLKNATDPARRLVFEYKIAFLEGHLEEGELKIRDLKDQVQGKLKDDPRLFEKDPELGIAYEEARAALRARTLAHIADLKEFSKLLKAQRDSKLVGSATFNAELLDFMEKRVKDEKADTLEEAWSQIDDRQAKLQAKFWREHAVQKGSVMPYVTAHLPSETGLFDKLNRERDDFLGLLQADSANPDLAKADGFEGLNYARVEGGLLEVHTGDSDAKAIRIVFGKEGGSVYDVASGTVYSVQPSDKDQVVVVSNGKFLAPHLHEGQDYLSGRYSQCFGAKSFPKNRQDGEGSAIKGLQRITGAIKQFGNHEDSDFHVLYDRYTRVGLEKESTPEGRREAFVEIAKKIRHYNGSYEIAGSFLEQVFAKDFGRILDDIKKTQPEKIGEIRGKAETDRPKLREKVVTQFKEAKREDASEMEIDEAVQRVVDTQINFEVSKLVYEKMVQWNDKTGGNPSRYDGQCSPDFSDKLSHEAFLIYNDMKDPTGEWFNLADNTWDSIIDEAVITAVTLPPTMGVGAAARGLIGGTSLAIRLAAQGGVRAFAVRAGIFVAGALTEGSMMTGIGAGITGTPFELKEVGRNVLMMTAFHGGGKGWGKLASKLNIGEEAIKKAVAAGGSARGLRALNGAGSLLTSTQVATAWSYLHDGDDRNFFERQLGELARMGGLHVASHVGNAVTGYMPLRLEVLANSRQAFARDSFKGFYRERLGQMRSKGMEWGQAKKIARAAAARDAAAYSRGLVFNPADPSVIPGLVLDRASALRSLMKSRAKSAPIQRVAPRSPKAPTSVQGQDLLPAAARQAKPARPLERSEEVTRAGAAVAHADDQPSSPGVSGVHDSPYNDPINAHHREMGLAVSQLDYLFGFIDGLRRDNPGHGERTSPVDILDSRQSFSDLTANPPVLREYGVEFDVRSQADADKLLNHIRDNAQDLGQRTIPLEIDAGKPEEPNVLRLKTPGGHPVYVRARIVEPAPTRADRSTMLPPPPPGGAPEANVPRGDLDLPSGNIARKAQISTDLNERIYGERKFPRYIGMELVEGLEIGIVSTLRERGHGKIADKMEKDLETAFTAGSDSSDYREAVDRLGDAMKLFKKDPRFSKYQMVDFMDPATLEGFSREIGKLYGTQPVAAKGSSAFLPTDALYSVAGAPALFASLADSIGTGAAAAITGVLTAVGLLGMVWRRGNANPERPNQAGEIEVRPQGGRDFVMGRNPGSDLVIDDASISGTHVTLHQENGVWYAVNGALGTSKKSLNGFAVGEKWVDGKFEPVKDGDRILIRTGEGGGTAWNTFVFRDPAKPAPTMEAPAKVSSPKPWTDRREDWKGIAAASNKGLHYKDANEDRYVVLTSPDGRSLMVAIDGMGGHAGGERAAEIARVAIEKAMADGRSVAEAMTAADAAITSDNASRGITRQAPGAVAMAVQLTPQADGTYRAAFTGVGDCEALVIRPGASQPVLHHTLRANSLSAAIRKASGKPFQTLPDGRLARGQTLDLRMDEYANMVDSALGGHDARIDTSAPDKPLRDGDIILTGSDGLFENFGRLDVIHEVIRLSGARTAAGIRDALMTEALIRMSLARNASNKVLSHRDYVAAYLEATGQEPPNGWRGMYEPWRDAAGQYHTYELDANGNVLHANSGRPVDHFKNDNVTLTVQVVGEPVHQRN